MANKYIFQLRRGWKYDKDPNTGNPRDDWAEYEKTKYIETKSYYYDAEYYTDRLGTVANPRPTKTEVEAGGYYIKNPEYLAPLDGELTLEYDNGIPRLKIGNGVDDFSKLPYMSADSFILPTPTTITLYGGDAWVPVLDGDEMFEENEGRFAQNITKQLSEKVTITSNSKIDLQPTPEQLYTFHQKDVAFTTVNDEGTVTVYAIGVRPEQKYDIQVTITEVAANV